MCWIIDVTWQRSGSLKGWQQISRLLLKKIQSGTNKAAGWNGVPSGEGIHNGSKIFHASGAPALPLHSLKAVSVKYSTQPVGLSEVCWSCCNLPVTLCPPEKVPAPQGWWVIKLELLPNQVNTAICWWLCAKTFRQAGWCGAAWQKVKNVYSVVV